MANSVNIGKVGSYAVSTINFDSWMQESHAPTVLKTRKPRGAKEVVHQVFTQCVSVMNDEFWIEKFQNMSRGKFPKKFTYNDGILYFRKGTKCVPLELTLNVHENVRMIIDFFHSHGGIFSPLDQQKSLEMQCYNGENIPLTWQTSNKKIRECMLSYYVTDIRQVMSLTVAEMEQLRQTIRMGISNKLFDKTNIDVRENRIQSIKGLFYNTEKRAFYIDPNLRPSSTRTYSRKKDDSTSSVDANQKDMIPQFNLKWRKYLEALDKKVARGIHRSTRHSSALSSINVLTDPDLETDPEEDSEVPDTE